MNELTIESVPKMSAKFFFLSLGVLITLITSVSSFLVLAFETLNQKYPDALNAMYQYGYNSYHFDTSRQAIATLIIVFPVTLILLYFWNRSARGILGSIDTIIRKWMIYLVLFLATVVVLVDLVTLVRYFVSGEITTRFGLKVLTTLVVAGVSGSYFILLLQKNPMRKYCAVLYAFITTILVLGLICCSFSIIGTPKMQRMWRFDDRRVQDLQSIQWQIIYYWQQKEALPATLATLADPISSYIVPVDPEFDKGLVYEYAITGELSFELCATFSAEMPQGWQENSYGRQPMPYQMMEGGKDMAMSYPYPGGTNNDSWDHDIGRTCFPRTIDPDIYPPYPKPDLDL